MNRADGLVQRRNVTHSADDRVGARGCGTGSDDDDDKRCSKEDDIESKETRFTLMEEILLLGLKDEQVLWHKAWNYCFYQHNGLRMDFK